jgi:hypothetical protein
MGNRNINGFRLNKNGKPILQEQGEKKFATYQGESFKEDSVYYFFVRKQNGMFIYNT